MPIEIPRLGNEQEFKSLDSRNIQDLTESTEPKDCYDTADGPVCDTPTIHVANAVEVNGVPITLPAGTLIVEEPASVTNARGEQFGIGSKVHIGNDSTLSTVDAIWKEKSADGKVTTKAQISNDRESYSVNIDELKTEDTSEKFKRICSDVGSTAILGTGALIGVGFHFYRTQIKPNLPKLP